MSSRFTKLEASYRAIVFVLLGVACGNARAAAIVNFEVGKSLELSGGGPSAMTLSVINAGDEVALVNSYTLGILVVQTSGSGVLTLDAWLAPTTNPLLSDVAAEYTPFDQPVLFPLNAPVTISGTEYFEYFMVQAANTNGFDDPLAVSSSRNIGLLNFTANGEPGAWSIYVINQASQSGGLPASFYQDSALTDSAFGNLPASDGAFLLVGSVATVPEPSSLMLVVCGVGATALNVRRRWSVLTPSRK